MPPVQYTLLNACRTLFGDEINLGPEFLAYLQPNGAKVAFRTQAKQHHPDYFAEAPPEVRARQTARFREIHQAYHLLAKYLEQRRLPRLPPPRPKPSSRADRQQAHHATSSHAKAHDVPPMPMEFGIFAYYRGKIDYRDLIDALVWQRRQRPAIGAIACRWGWLNDAKVRQILTHRGNSGRFGRKAVELGILSPLQVEALLRHQRAHQQRLGQYFIECGLLTTIETEQLARDLERHNTRCAGGRR
ncbi:MAG: J domain-containing protein [Desulfuromonadales bacterium]|nr:J domain-containing protein [Desulfuromonadales bacterium]